MRIIAATDFSESAEQALNVAGLFGRRLGCTVEVCHVDEGPPASFEYSTMASDPALYKELRSRSRAALAAAAEKLSKIGVQVEAQLLEGYPPESLAARARASDALLIVVGTHGRRALARMFLGSVSERTVLLADRPVLVVANMSNALGAWASGERPLRVVVGVDGTRASNAALVMVNKLRALAPVAAKLIHCYWPPPEANRLGVPVPQNLEEADPRIAQAIEKDLAHVLATVSDAGPSSGGRTTFEAQPCWGSVSAALSVAATDNDADLLVLGAHQRTGLERLRLGSTVHSALHEATVPVLCVPVTYAAAPVTAPEPRSTFANSERRSA